jgi:excisionase family DNA binding protein
LDGVQTLSDNLGEKATPLPKLAYSMREAAQVLGISYITVHRLLKRGLLRSSSALRTKVISHAEIERFLRSTTK